MSGISSAQERNADFFGTLRSYSLNPSSNALRSPGAIPTSSRADFGESMNTLENFFSPMDPPLPATSTETGMDLDDLLSSPMTFSDEEMANINLGNPNFPSTAFDSSSTGSESFYGAFPVLDGATPNSTTFYTSSPSTYPTPSPEMQRIAPAGTEAHNYEEVSATGSPCACLVQALAIMRNLISTPPDPYKSFATQNLDNATAMTTWTVQAVIARNQTSIEAVGTMLQCSCSHDGYLLAVMALITFKVMGWYEAVARDTPCWQGSCAHTSPQQLSGQEQMYHNQTNVIGGGCCLLECANSTRMVAQMIMTELQRVRYLVEQLSSKLKIQAAKKGGGRVGGGQGEQGRGVAPPGGWDWDHEMTLPLSTTMYDHMDADLKKRLRALSSEMMDRLRGV